MVSRLKIGIGILILTTLGCIVYYVNANGSYEYKNELPKEPTSQMLDFFRQKLFYDKRLITKDHPEGYIYQIGSINDQQTDITYAFSPTEKIHKYHDERLKSEEDNKYAIRNVNADNYLKNIHHPTKYGLPDIKLTDEVLKIQTAEEELMLSTISLTEKDQLDVNKAHNISVMGVNDDAFYLRIITNESDDHRQYLLFVQQDLTDYHLIAHNDEAFEQFMRTKEFLLYQSLFPPIDDIDDDERYLIYYANSQDQEKVIDMKKKKLITIGEKDYLSGDGKYVYLSANHRMLDSGLSEGMQYIQALEDYLAGNGSHEMTFELDFKTIRKASDIGGIGATASDGGQKVVYFKDELLILHVSYDALYIGIAGTTNVVIDFHEDQENPEMYVLDLSAS